MNIFSVIKHEPTQGELVYKHPADAITMGSVLVVYPSQTAFLVKGGQICDAFTAGSYTLSTENIPILYKLVNLPFNSSTPFPAEVWFVNQVSLLDCKWGTISPIQIEDPKYNIIIPVRGYGQYGFRVSEPRLLLERFVGAGYGFDCDRLKDYFKGVILSKLTNIITDKFTAEGLSVVNINSHVDLISEYARECLRKVFADYGVELELFNVITINVDESDESFQRLKETKDTAARIKIIGRDDYRMSQSFNVMQAAAENEGAGIAGPAVGLGAGLGMGAQMGNIMAGNLSTAGSVPPPLPKAGYYLGINGQPIGPMDRDGVLSLVANGTADGNTLVWKSPMPDWVALSAHADFADMFNNITPPPLPQN